MLIDGKQYCFKCNKGLKSRHGELKHGRRDAYDPEQNAHPKGTFYKLI